MLWGKVSRAAAVGQVVSGPDTSPHVSAADSAGGCLARTSFRGPQLKVDAHDGTLWVRKAVSLPLESPSSSRADEVSAPFTWACAG